MVNVYFIDFVAVVLRFMGLCEVVCALSGEFEGDYDVMFVGILLCGFERQHGVVLGQQLQWPSDTFKFVVLGGCCVFWGTVLCG